MTDRGKFSCHPLVIFISRWNVQTAEALTFKDPFRGELTVPQGFVSDLASIRLLREICRWAALAAFFGGVLTWTWVSTLLLAMSVGALALYGLLAGYGMRAAILHDWLYATRLLPRHETDAVFYRALRTGDGIARWRAAVFWLGVRAGGALAYTRTPVRPGF